TSVLWKVQGRTWLDGTAAAVPLYHPTFARFPAEVADILAPWSPILTYVTLAFEAAWILMIVPSSLLPFGLTRDYVRRRLILGGVALRVGILILMDVGLFSVAMIVSYAGLLTDRDFAVVRM